MRTDQRTKHGAAALLWHLLAGEVINRKNVPADVGEWNCSLHVLVTHLRTKRLIPVIGAVPRATELAQYQMTPEDIALYHEDLPKLQAQQADAVALARILAGVRHVRRTARYVAGYPDHAQKNAAALCGAAQELVSALPRLESNHEQF